MSAKEGAHFLPKIYRSLGRMRSILLSAACGTFLPVSHKYLPLVQILFTALGFPVYCIYKHMKSYLLTVPWPWSQEIRSQQSCGMGVCMKVKIEIVDGLEEEEVIIRCGNLNDSVISLQNYLSKQNNGKRCLLLTAGGTDFFIPMEDIYFFETEGREIRAHTADKIFTCGCKLYELEEMLPGSFMRISKSTIANLDHIYSITRNLTASSMVEFKDSLKKAMVSRSYYKLLLERLNARRLGR